MILARPPQEDSHIPTDGENEPFRGTSPWSGPYLLLVIMAGALLFVGGIALVFLWKLGTF